MARDADRMHALLRKARVINDPCRDRRLPFHRRQHKITHRVQNRRIRPRGLADEVKQRLMLSRRPVRRDDCRHGLDALAFTGQQQSGAIMPQRAGPIHMTERLAQGLDISREPRFASIQIMIHRDARIQKSESPPYQISRRQNELAFVTQ